MKAFLLKATAFVSLLVIISGFISLRGDYFPSSPPDTSEAPEGSVLSGGEEKDRDEGERIMRSFTATYYSYRLGDVSNIVSLYGSMCTELGIAERSRVENLQKQFGNSPDYVTVDSEVKNSEVVSYDENRIVVRIAVDKTTWNGALIPDAKKKGSYVLVDKTGKPYGGDKYDLKETTAMETYEVTGIKEMSEWKVCKLEKISH